MKFYNHILYSFFLIGDMIDFIRPGSNFTGIAINLQTRWFDQVAKTKSQDNDSSSLLMKITKNTIIQLPVIFLTS